MTVRAPPNPPASLLERMARAREAHLAQLARGEDPDFRGLQRIAGEISRALFESFEHRCGYCNSSVGVTDSGSIDHFYPKYKFPERAFDWDNLMLSCHACNISKMDHFPLDAHGDPLLFNPRTDDPQSHFKLNEDGRLRGLTPKGTASIEIFRLNREALAEARRRERLYEKLADQRPELRAALFEDDFHARFVTSIASTKALNAVAGLSDSTEQSMRYMLYASIIASLETYLGDALIATTKGARRYMRQFVETFHDFNEIKFRLSEVFARYDTIEEVAIKAMADVLYHDLAKVSGIYKAALGVSIPTDIKDLYQAVSVRHDIVHRNGKNRDGVYHSISREAVDKLAERVTEFVSTVHEQINKLHQQSPDDE